MDKPTVTTSEVRDLLTHFEGQEITLDKVRSELQIERGTKSFDAVRNIFLRLVEARVIRYISRGNYKVIMPVSPVSVFGQDREHRPPFELIFPRDFETGMEMDFANNVTIREGDLITIGGVKSKGKTTLMMNFCGENVDKLPILMGNEYTIIGEDGWEPQPRWFNRMEIMGQWIDWTDENGQDKFTLMPVHDDYAEHIVKHRLNLIDWININGERLYDIGKILEGIKRAEGRGVTIVALQKGDGADNPRGGQFVRDFSDLELLLDGFGSNEDDILLTIKGAKEKNAPIVGNRYSYTIRDNGTKIVNFRQVKQCNTCYGKGYTKTGKCDTCFGAKWTDK
ncbi:hypothetical protein LCGC14_2040030 [marine sediment metagenome]|uniref:Uncharacterized protein n=1 Tax=marine sediment metagenome TaxID=412755 RepID=A0A0F9HP78_9ZZZZ